METEAGEVACCWTWAWTIPLPFLPRPYHSQQCICTTCTAQLKVFWFSPSTSSASRYPLQLLLSTTLVQTSCTRLTLKNHLRNANSHLFLADSLAFYFTEDNDIWPTGTHLNSRICYTVLKISFHLFSKMTKYSVWERSYMPELWNKWSKSQNRTSFSTQNLLILTRLLSE